MKKSWKAELDKRMREVETGAVRSVPWAEVKARLTQQIETRRQLKKLVATVGMALIAFDDVMAKPSSPAHAVVGSPKFATCSSSRTTARAGSGCARQAKSR